MRDEVQFGGTFSEWCVEMVNKCKVERSWEIIIMFVWQIWNLRNSWTYEKKRTDPMLAYNRTMKLVGEYEAAMTSEQGPVAVENQVQTSWQAPVSAPFKLNVDAAVRDDIIGVGMVVRDEVGDVLMSAGMGMRIHCEALQAEAEAM